MAEEEKKESLESRKAKARINFKPSEEQIVTIEADKDKFSAVVIWLHGLGDRGNSWKMAIKPIAQKYPYIKWIFPTASTAPVTFYGGMRATAWHDIVSLEKWEENTDFMGRDVTVQFITNLISKEIEENEIINSQRILIGGFSQGGATALFTGLTSQIKLAGIVCLSGYLPEINIKPLINNNNKDIPILMYHCKGDAIVDSKLANMAYNTLKNQCDINNIQLKFNGAIPGADNNNGHCTTPKEMQDVAKFIGQRLPSDGTIASNDNYNSSGFCVLL